MNDPLKPSIAIKLLSNRYTPVAEQLDSLQKRWLQSSFTHSEHFLIWPFGNLTI